MIKVAICDDHKIVREGIRQIIEGFHDIELVPDEIASGEELVQKLRTISVDIVLLDVSLPGRNGLEVLKQLKIFYPEINVLILSMYPEDQFAIRMLKAGASGYLHKDSSPELLIEAIRTIHKEDEYLSPEISQLLYHEVNNKGDQLPHQLLSDREYEIFLAIGEGKPNILIASELSLSAKTISTYRTRVLSKMKMESNSDLVKYIIMHELAPID